MSGQLQEDQLKKIEDIQKQKLLRIQQQDTIHKNLTGLQSWNLAQGQTLEERREAHKEAMIHDQMQENAAMQNAARAQLAQANANAAAPGAPVQEQAPAKQTHKKRMERGWKAKRARISCPYGTADSYDCEEAISRVIQERKNARKSVSKDTKGIYPDVLGTFCQGYKVNWRGKPATPEDQAKADSDNAFLKAYLSMDLKKRKPYLEAFHKELMDFPLSADSVSEAYLIQNVDAVKRITDKSIYFDIIMKDPINKPYFDSLSPAEKELLKEKLSMMEKFRIHFLDRMRDLGVDASTGRYYNDNSIIRDRASARRVKEERSELTAGWEQKKREILERHMENEAAQEREQKLRGISEDQAKQTTHRPEDMNFSSPAAGYATDELKRYRAMIEENPDAYVANQPLIDQLYQELYRNMDILNDFVFNTMVYQGVCDRKNESPNSTDKALARLAFKKVERYMNSIDTVRKKSDPIGQALEFYLKGKPLTDAAESLLKQIQQKSDSPAPQQ